MRQAPAVTIAQMIYVQAFKINVDLSICLVQSYVSVHW